MFINLSVFACSSRFGARSARGAIPALRDPLGVECVRSCTFRLLETTAPETCSQVDLGVPSRLLTEDCMKSRSRHVPMRIAATELEIIWRGTARSLGTSGARLCSHWLIKPYKSVPSEHAIVQFDGVMLIDIGSSSNTHTGL